VDAERRVRIRRRIGPPDPVTTGQDIGQHQRRRVVPKRRHFGQQEGRRGEVHEQIALPQRRICRIENQAHPAGDQAADQGGDGIRPPRQQARNRLSGRNPLRQCGRRVLRDAQHVAVSQCAAAADERDGVRIMCRAPA